MSQECSRFEERQLACPCYENAFILVNSGQGPAGVASNDGTYIHETYVDGYGYRDKTTLELDKIEKTAIYLGSFTTVWGHLFTDHFKRLWFLETEECRQLIESGAELVYVTVDNNPVNDIAKQFFKRAGFDSNQWRHITENCRYSRVYVPDSSIFLKLNPAVPYGDRFYTREYSDIINRIKNSIQDTIKIPKVYFTRSCLKNNGWRECGERSLEQFFSKRGFVVIPPEALSLDDQLSILKNCQCFVATEGSVSHSAVFCSKATEVVILKKAKYENTYQYILNEVAKINSVFLKAFNYSNPANKTFIWYGPFYMNVTKEIRAWAGADCFVFPMWARCSFWIFKMRNSSLFSFIFNRKFAHNLEDFLIARRKRMLITKVYG